MNQRKLRLIKSKQITSTEVHGITIPPEVATFFKDTYFTVLKNGNDILLKSGTQLSQVAKQTNQTDKISLEDYRV